MRTQIKQAFSLLFIRLSSPADTQTYSLTTEMLLSRIGHVYHFSDQLLKVQIL